MTRPSTRLIWGSLGFAVLLLLLTLVGPTNGQPQHLGSNGSRYHAILGGPNVNLIVIDTFTGRCWTALPKTETEVSWRDLGTPVDADD